MRAGGEHAVALRGVAALHVGVGDGHHVGTEQRADPADGAHEGLALAPPPLAAVVRPLQVGDHVVTQGGEDGQRGLGGNVALGEDVLAAIRVLAAHELGGIDAVLAGEALGGLGGVALGVEGDVRSRAAVHLMELLGRRGDVANVGGQAAG